MCSSEAVLVIKFLIILRKYIKEIKKMEGLILAKENNLKIYEKWLNKIQDKKTVSSYLIRNGYSKISIYGMGHVGRNLYREFQNSGIETVYGIDKSISNYGKLRCYPLNEDLPETDLIIVTVTTGTDAIVKELKEKVQYPVESLTNILFML